MTTTVAQTPLLAEVQPRPPDRHYNFGAPLSGGSSDERKPYYESRLIADLMSTTAFRRLAGVAFLGAQTYAIGAYSRSALAGVHSRATHSLGVMRLAAVYCVERGWSDAQRDEVLAAALLHDIGHPPLSHSAEGAFRERAGLDHHTATRGIILGEHDLGREVHDALQDHRASPQRVARLALGEVERYDQCLSGPINCDTIEGVLRTRIHVETIDELTPIAVATASAKRETERDRDVVDAFWQAKHDAYERIVNSPQGRAADFIALSTVNDADIDAAGLQTLFFGTDADVFHRCPDLQRDLHSRDIHALAADRFGTPAVVGERRYWIDRSQPFGLPETDAVRYRKAIEQRRIETGRDRPQTEKPHVR